MSAAPDLLADGAIGIYKDYNYIQTDSGTGSLTFDSGEFSVYFSDNGTPGLDVDATNTLVLPAGSTHTSGTLTFGPGGGGGASYDITIGSQTSETESEWDTRFLSGDYTISMSIQGTAQNVAINLANKAESRPAITNGTWTSGTLEVDAWAGFELQWAEWTNADPLDHIELSIGSVGSGALAASSTSFSVPGFALDPGTYAATLSFWRDNSDKPGELSNMSEFEATSYTTSFTLVAVPEPSTGLLALFGGAAVFAVRRKQRLS